jgi:hypothetical protein
VTEYRAIILSLENGLQAKLMFRQFQTNGDWICQMSDDIMEDLETMIEIQEEGYQ